MRVRVLITESYGSSQETLLYAEYEDILTTTEEKAGDTI